MKYEGTGWCEEESAGIPLTPPVGEVVIIVILLMIVMIIIPMIIVLMAMMAIISMIISMMIKGKEYFTTAITIRHPGTLGNECDTKRLCAMLTVLF